MQLQNKVLEVYFTAIISDPLPAAFLSSWKMGERFWTGLETREIYMPECGLHYNSWPEIPEGSVVHYYTGVVESHLRAGGAQFPLHVGSWEESGLGRFTLTVPEGSVCFLPEETGWACPLLMVMEDVDGRERDTLYRILFVRKDEGSCMD